MKRACTATTTRAPGQQFHIRQRVAIRSTRQLSGNRIQPESMLRYPAANARRCWISRNRRLRLAPVVNR
jgi:hypothetical protein